MILHVMMRKKLNIFSVVDVAILLQTQRRLLILRHLMLSQLPGSPAGILISTFYQDFSRMQIFGQDNVTVNELVNPGNFHFRSFNVRNSSCLAHQEGWQVRDRSTQDFM